MKKPDKKLAEKREKELIRDFFDHKENGIFVEVGGNEPVSETSQSWHLEQMLNWHGLIVEPIPELAHKAKKSRSGAIVCECACTSPEKQGALTLYIPVKDGNAISSHAATGKNLDVHHYKNHTEIKVKAKTLDELLERNSISRIDLLSIDVEGAEMDVLLGFDIEKYKPELILLEDKHVHLMKHRHLKKKGYVLAKRTKQNCWYVKKGSKRPDQTFSEKVKLLKRLYISIWWKKLRAVYTRLD